jgi:hypothetical protein
MGRRDTHVEPPSGDGQHGLHAYDVEDWTAPVA